MRMIYMKDNHVGYICSNDQVKELLKLDVFCELPTVKITTSVEVSPQLFNGFIKKYKKVEVVVSDIPIKKEIKQVKKRTTRKTSKKKIIKKKE